MGGYTMAKNNRQQQHLASPSKRPGLPAGKTVYRSELPTLYQVLGKQVFRQIGSPLIVLLLFPIFLVTFPLDIFSVVQRYRKMKRAHVSRFSVDNLRLQRIFHWADRNQIEEKIIPRDPLKLLHLKKLHLTAKDLHHLPEEIGLLKGLEVLYLSRNHLKYLPASIGSITALKELHLDGNRIDKLTTALPPFPG